MALLTLDPASFRRPKGQQSTRHLYLANCGYGLGESVETVLERLQAAQAQGAQTEVLGLHVGTGGVSYASFSDALTAETVKAYLEASTKWVVRFAEMCSEASSGVLLPESVAATEHVVVPGVHLVTNFITDEEASNLLEEIDGRSWDTSIKRRVQHYGHAFDYATLKIAKPGTVPDMPAFAGELISRLSESCLMPHGADQLTINEYQPGVGIAFHVDAHSAFEDGIAAITLGSGIVMEFRKADETSGKLSMGRKKLLRCWLQISRRGKKRSSASLRRVAPPDRLPAFSGLKCRQCASKTWNVTFFCCPSGCGLLGFLLDLTFLMWTARNSIQLARSVAQQGGFVLCVDWHRSRLCSVRHNSRIYGPVAWVMLHKKGAVDFRTLEPVIASKIARRHFL
ncbi:ALKBH8 [Symbiodinium necroappetens]|uniref:ALKBH8 protein n=1 Tax=Symbiodinium necroappetens TaxID=1628268 RepID=A0A812JN11_9DINO|nr:ALKBH8 [Symbiodinium necroappetens]